jgi:hypothetical protein
MMSIRLRRATSLLILGLILPPAFAGPKDGVAPFKLPEDVPFRTRDIISEDTRTAADDKGEKPSAVPEGGADAKDWPMYNRDVIGTRHNPAETSIGKDNAVRLVEK